MARLKTLKSRVQEAASRQFANPVAEGADSWGSGRGGRPWRRKRDAILLRDKYTCQVCGVTTNHLEVDHVVNLAQGGTDEDDNLQAICVPCHKLKTAAESVQGRG
ncbi:HNH endonuclease [Pseudomonas putida]|uniref:HNH endonuclease n=1 Tax=Pseudomonas putida TaxID=303 RepID=UPI00236358DF|nr:HNH endonuclease [Pseudomonas putida]MDD2054183.1 HNH endonuclease [Pseudomonas putida]